MSTAPAGNPRLSRERTARCQVPRYVRTVAALPRTQTQRVEKFRLREEGVTDFEQYAVTPGARLYPDLFLE